MFQLSGVHYKPTRPWAKVPRRSLHLRLPLPLPHPYPKKEPNAGKLTYTSGNRSPKILKGNLQSLKIKKVLCIFLERTQVFQIILIFFRSIIVFSILKKLSFFIFWEIFVTFTTILLLFFFFFFRKVLIPFSSFFCIFVVFLYFFDNT